MARETVAAAERAVEACQARVNDVATKQRKKLRGGSASKYYGPMGSIPRLTHDPGVELLEKAKEALASAEGVRAEAQKRLVGLED